MCLDVQSEQVVQVSKQNLLVVDVFSIRFLVNFGIHTRCH